MLSATKSSADYSGGKMILVSVYNIFWYPAFSSITPCLGTIMPTCLPAVSRQEYHNTEIVTNKVYCITFPFYFYPVSHPCTSIPAAPAAYSSGSVFPPAPCQSAPGRGAWTGGARRRPSFFSSIIHQRQAVCAHSSVYAHTGCQPGGERQSSYFVTSIMITFVMITFIIITKVIIIKITVLP